MSRGLLVNHANRLAGLALHCGETTSITLARREGPLTLYQGERSAPLDALFADRLDLGVALSDGAGLRVDMVEHLMAAFAGLGVRHGVGITVDGPEVPLLDGGSRALAEAILREGVGPSPPLLVVSKRGELRVGESTYQFDLGDRVEVEVDVSYDHPEVGRQRSRWTGDPDDFVAHIARARTFGFARDENRLFAAGRARGVDLNAVIVFTEEGVHPGCRAPEKDEIARHKLLDLIGDWGCYGGPPLGVVRAIRPGHAPNHAAVQRALDEGIVSRRCA